MDLRKEVGYLHCPHFNQNSSQIIEKPGEHLPSPVCDKKLGLPVLFHALGRTQLLDDHRVFWWIWSCERATGIWYVGVAVSPEKPPSRAVHQNCFLCVCLLLQTPSRERKESHSGWLLSEWGLLLQRPCTFLLFPVFPLWFSGECGLHWRYTRGKEK